ncbi:MAG: DUF5117 domain-containing protein, partial [Saprospiraceae bacterium]
MRIFTFFVCILFCACSTASVVTNQPNKAVADPISELTKSMTKTEGYVNFYWDETKGSIFLEIDKLDQEILYVNALPAGIGSNDIGLDRGQLGDTRIIKFQKVGPKILMIQPNYDYRAISDNPEESKSVAQAFASSVIGGFKVVAAHNGKYIVDATKFLLRD